jgi:hypothetical protein
VSEGLLRLHNGKQYKADAIIVAAVPSFPINSKDPVTPEWHGCDTLYFEVDDRIIKRPLIGLVNDSNAIVNNIFYPTSIGCKSKGEKELLSVTIVKEHNLDEERLIQQVSEDLKVHCNIENAQFLKRYQIKKALPALESLKDQWDVQSGKKGSSIYLAGDHLLYGSSNAALLSGELAAKAIIDNVLK